MSGIHSLNGNSHITLVNYNYPLLLRSGLSHLLSVREATVSDRSINVVGLENRVTDCVFSTCQPQPIRLFTSGFRWTSFTDSVLHSQWMFGETW